MILPSRESDWILILTGFAIVSETKLGLNSVEDAVLLGGVQEPSPGIVSGNK